MKQATALPSMRTQTPVYIDAEDRQALLNCLSTHPDQKFRAAQLTEATGVPKSKVRGLLSGLSEVVITTRKTMHTPDLASNASGFTQGSKTYWYQWQKVKPCVCDRQ